MISTAVEPIKAYSPGHLVFCLIVLLLAVSMVRILKKADKEKLIFVTGIVLAVLEVIKQILMYRIYGFYSWSDLPFQLCSIPMYMCLIFPFLEKGRGVIELFLRSFGLLGAIGAFAVPYDVFSKYLFLSVQSIIWHTILVFLGIYCMAVPAGRNRISLRNIRDTALLYLGLAVIAICINALFFRISNGTANMFFLGPAKPYVIILDDIYNKYGWAAESAAMICGSELFGTLILLLSGIPGRITARTER